MMVARRLPFPFWDATFHSGRTVKLPGSSVWFHTLIFTDRKVGRLVRVGLVQLKNFYGRYRNLIAEMWKVQVRNREKMIWVKQVSTSSLGILNHIRDPMTLIFVDALDPSLWIITSCGCWIKNNWIVCHKETYIHVIYNTIYTLPKNHVSQIPSIWNALFVVEHILFVSKDWRIRPSMLRLVDDCYARKAQYASWDWRPGWKLYPPWTWWVYTLEDST